VKRRPVRQRRSRRYLLGVTALLASLSISRASVASSRDADAARQWFAHGLAAAHAGDLAGARKEFAAAYALVPSVDILWNLAAVERKLGDSVAALQHLRTYVASPEARRDRKKLAEEELLPEVEAGTAHLALAEPDGVTVRVDGNQVDGRAVLDLAPGMHAVTISGDGADRTVALELAPSVVTHLPAPTAVAPISRADGDVGVAVAPAPAPAAAIASSPPTWSRTPAIVALGGAAMLTVAAGIYFSFAARNAQETADRLEVQLRSDDLSCRRSGTLCDDYDSARTSAQRGSLLGTTLLVSGGILGGSAIATWLLWPSSATRVTPTAAKDSAGVMMTGRF
jgi:hypothetical protein